MGWNKHLEAVRQLGQGLQDHWSSLPKPMKAIVGAPLGFMIWLYSDNLADYLKNWLVFSADDLLPFFLGLSLIALGLSAFLAWSRRKARASLRELSLSLYTSDKSGLQFERWEEIKKLSVGHIAYKPLLYDTYQEFPSGLGPCLLQSVLPRVKLKVKPDRAMCSWDSFLSDVSSGRIDLLLTPVFETAERASQVAFTQPVCFADIGIYVAAQDNRVTSKADGLSFEDAKKELRKITNLRAVVLKGEISERLLRRNVPNAEITIADPRKSDVPSLLAQIADNFCDNQVLIAEKIQADNVHCVKQGEVINLLKPRQLMYPLGFCVRRSEYVLRHFLNFHLLVASQRNPQFFYEVLTAVLTDANWEPSIIDMQEEYYVRSDEVKTTGQGSPVGETIPFKPKSRG